MANKHTKNRTTLIDGNLGKPPGMNYAQFLQWKKMIYEECLETARSEVNRVLADRQAQRMSWFYKVALNENPKFNFGAQRNEELDRTVKEQIAKYEQLVKENGQDYADESLRQRVCQILGREVKYLYEDQYPVNMELSEEQFAALREADGRIY